MCWNADVSLNTFIFSFFVLLLIIYNNEYTKYKIKEFDDIAVYIFIFSVITMQLVEYFIWKNISNKSVIQLLSYIGLSIVFIQPIAALFILKDVKLRWNLLAIYFAITVPIFIHSLLNYKINVSVSSLGHLIWENWYNKDTFLLILRLTYFFMIFYPLFIEKKYTLLIFSLVSLIWAAIHYFKTKTIGSMWCWSVNTFAIYSAFYILFYLPFQEKCDGYLSKQV